ncbi:VanZ family protein [Listeria sp. PSOL-1]|uniref:VanZ family protein n=1 Tax=Listeria sp. PSOL-1 TaxID=1844999 RepID=UPI0013D4E2CC|nr:VanZ family protein [Listeria sp. PSOL-1]
MLTFSVLVIAIAIVIYLCFFLVRWIHKKEKIENIIFKTCLYVYSCGVIKYTLFPVLISSQLLKDRAEDITGPFFNLIPFHTINEIFSIRINIESIMQIVLNIVLFVPLGILLPLCFNKISWKTVFLIGLSTSICIELIQLMQNIIYQAPFKFTDIDDIMLNVFGNVIGYVLFLTCKPLFQRLGLCPKITSANLEEN